MGILQSPYIPPYHCPTGNCHFPDFSTLSVCHTCEDMSDSIIGRNHSSYYAKEPQNYNYTTPRRSTSSFGSTIDPDSSFQSLNIQYFDDDAEHLRLEFQKNSLENLAYITVLSVPFNEQPDEKNGGYLSWLGKPRAIACHLNFCTRTIRAKVVDSVLEEEVIGRAAMAHINENYNGLDLFYMVDYQYCAAVATTTTTGGGDEKEGGSQNDFLPAGGRTSNSSSSAGVPSPAASQQQQPCVAQTEPGPGLVKVPLRSLDKLMIPPGLSPRFNVSSSEARWLPEACVYAADFLVASDVHNALLAQLDTWEYVDGGNQDTLEAGLLYGQAGIVDLDRMDRFMGNISDSLSAWIRGNGPPPPPPHANNSSGGEEFAAGTSFETMQCVQVRWAWLSFSAMLVGLAAIWLALLILLAPRGEATRRGWKSSSLAVLFAVAAVEERLASAGEEYWQWNTGSKGGAATKPVSDFTRHELEQIAMSVSGRLVGGGEDGRMRFE